MTELELEGELQHCWIRDVALLVTDLDRFLHWQVLRTQNHCLREDRLSDLELFLLQHNVMD